MKQSVISGIMGCLLKSGADPGFSEGGSESGVGLEGRSYPKCCISEAGGLGGTAPQKLLGI